jgi:hypothetical protein
MGPVEFPEVSPIALAPRREISPGLRPETPVWFPSGAGFGHPAGKVCGP